MLPTNSGQAKDQGCSPVSSNCVVWQGPDLECIGLCKGDSVSEVIAKMATDLCTLIDMFDLAEYDFTCLAIPVSETPADVGDLIQVLIDRICALEGLSPITPGGLTTDCPENCLVPIADCFYFIDPQGDTVTTMSLLDYVTAIGNRICDILNDITALQDAVNTLQQQQLDTATDIETLQTDKQDISGLQYQVNTKTDPSAGVEFITDALRSVENNTLQHFDASGNPTDTYKSILQQGNIGQQNKAFGTGTYDSLTGWISDPLTTADMDNNQWLVLNNINEAVNYINENCCSTGCSDIVANFRIGLSGPILTIFFDGSTGFTPDWAECTGSTPITVTDELGNSTTITTSLIALIDNPLGYSFNLDPTSVDFTTNITAVADTCFINTATETQCNQDYTDTVVNSPVCPTVILTSYATSVNYQFTTTAGYTYICNVYYNGGTTPVASQVIASPGAIVLQSIMGLLESTNYEFEVIVVDALGGETACPKQLFTTLPSDCQPPINASAMITI